MAAPYNPAIPGIYPKKAKTIIWKDICTPVFTVALFYNSRDMEAALASTHGWMDGWTCGTYVRRDVSQPYKNDILPVVTTRMDPKGLR